MPFAPAAAAAACVGVSAVASAGSFIRLPSPRARRTAFMSINATVPAIAKRAGDVMKRGTSYCASLFRPRSLALTLRRTNAAAAAAAEARAR